MTKRMSASEYHDTDQPTYFGSGGSSFKREANIAEVEYSPSHFNAAAPNGMQGEGKTLGRWLFNEESQKKEGILKSNIELIMDTRLEPKASIGLHEHVATEEMYYLLEGSITVTLMQSEQRTVETLSPGDVHRVAPGESHFIQAGDNGARFMVIAAKAAL